MGPTITNVAMVMLVKLLLGACRGALQVEEVMDMTSKLTKDTRLDESPFLTFTPRGIRWCAEECYRRPRCESFNFKMATLTCELITKRSGQCSKVAEEGTHYGDSSAWPGAKKGSCGGGACGENFKCARNARNGADCLPTECSAPPIVSNAVSGRTFAEIGSTVTYSCESGHTLSGNPTMACRTNTSWTGPGFSCT